MSMDPKAAQNLRKLFATRAGQYPYLLPEAEILFENGAGSKLRFYAATPLEAANVLQHCLNNDGAGIFSRELENGSIAPISILMNKRVRLSPDNREAFLEAFRMTYQSLEDKGHLRINDPEINDYFWQGDERISKGTIMTFNAPKLADVIATLQRAGGKWKDVNFLVSPGRKTHLRLASVNTAFLAPDQS